MGTRNRLIALSMCGTCNSPMCLVIAKREVQVELVGFFSFMIEKPSCTCVFAPCEIFTLLPVNLEADPT